MRHMGQIQVQMIDTKIGVTIYALDTQGLTSDNKG